MFFVIWRIVPREDSHHTLTNNSRAGYRAVFTSIPALAGISIAMCASAGNELVNVIFGVWLEDSFGLKIAALAGASAVIGISELSGEGLVAFTTDRLGKPLALTIGLVGNALASILLPFIGQTQVGALIGLFLFYITFEYIMVSHISLVTRTCPFGTRHDAIAKCDRSFTRTRLRRISGRHHLSTIWIFVRCAFSGGIQYCWFTGTENNAAT